MATVEIIFATNNANKVKEIKAVTGNLLTVLSLADAGIDIDIPEPHDTLEANASEKSKVIHGLTQKNCFSEDTGLEIVALNGESLVLKVQDMRVMKEIFKLILT